MKYFPDDVKILHLFSRIEKLVCCITCIYSAFSLEFPDLKSWLKKESTVLA